MTKNHYPPYPCKNVVLPKLKKFWLYQIAKKYIFIYEIQPNNYANVYPWLCFVMVSLHRLLPWKWRNLTNVPQSVKHPGRILVMMTSSNGNIFRITVPFVRGIHRWPVDSPHKGKWRGALMSSLICLSCAWTNGWTNNRDAGDLRRHRVHYDVTVM